MRTVKETEKLSTASLDKWPMYTSTVQKCVEEDGKVVFQCQDLKNFSLAKCYYANHYTEYCSKVVECIKSRLSWSDMQQLRDIIFVLASQGWHKAVDEEESIESVDRLAQQFSIPFTICWC